MLVFLVHTGTALVSRTTERLSRLQNVRMVPCVVAGVDEWPVRKRRDEVDDLYELCEAVGPESSRTDLVPAYVRLLRDNEAEVRIAGGGKELSSDSSQHVLSVLASVIMGVGLVLGKNSTIEQLLPISLSLLKDEFPDFFFIHLPVTFTLSGRHKIEDFVACVDEITSGKGAEVVYGSASWFFAPQYVNFCENIPYETLFLLGKPRGYTWSFGISSTAPDPAP
ncbi:hypothetical protein V6N12_037587 [Hibiscus sabdariffa]|uniref:Uncharacterized protein n=1 Tax=Hibiscus sabdariffa TaxID=183260 RepID=A0ABR2C190_9ROSI